MFRSIGTQWMFDTGIHPGVVTQSARFSDVSNKYLQRTDSTTPTSTQKFTFSCWLKNSTLNSGDTIFGSDKGTAGGPGDAAWIQFTTNRRLNIYNITGASYNLQWTSDAMYRDVMNWYHFVIRVDTTQGSADNRVRLYVNGTQQTGSYATTVGQNNNVSFNNAAGKFRIAGLGYADGYEGDFYLADIHHCDGYSYAPTEFGEDKNGVWIPKIASVSYGNTGYRLEFKNSTVGSTSGSASTIGADTSGNGHHFNDYNMGIDDSNIPDCPDNNFSTWNPLFRGGEKSASMTGSAPTLSEGNLEVSLPVNSYIGNTFRPTRGRWYVEIRIKTLGSVNGEVDWGWLQANEYSGTTGHSGQAKKWGAYYHAYSTAHIRLYDETSQLGSNINLTLAAGSILQLAWDVDKGKGWIGVDNVWYHTDSNNGNPSSGVNETFTFTADEAKNLQCYIANGTSTDVHTVNFGQDPTFGGTLTGANTGTAKGGGGTFKYTPPTGFNALCSNALEDGIISPNPSASSAPTDHFNIVLKSMSTNSEEAITGVGFQPDWIWGKSRNSSYDHHIYDSLRGATKYVLANSNSSETTDANSLKSFDADGFTVGSGSTFAPYSNGNNVVFWCWKAGGAPTASNTAGVGEVPTAGSVLIDGKQATAPLAGSIKIDKLSANTLSGFSIVTYTANSNTQCTLPHGLNSAPNMVIIKNRDASSNGQWVIGQDQNGFTGQLYLDDGGAFSSNSGSFANTAPTSSVVTINTDNTVNEGTDEFVMYCFHNVEGFSKIGSYGGNNSTDGPYVYTGFRPSWIMLKRSNDSGSFQLLDDKRNPSNPTDLYLFTPGNGAEVDGSGLGTPIIVDFLSNGFKVRSTEAVYNSSGGRFLYLAFAGADFKTSNAR